MRKIFILALYTISISCFAQTKYTAPEWAKEVVWYQIFPERFRNGDPKNEPSCERANGSEGWHPTSWTQDWYKMDDWEKKDAKDFYTNVNKRRFGGDLQGVIDKLDYLKGLGIGAIYINPVFDAQSLHKYDASYYHHIDRNFGPDPKGDATLFATENPGDPRTYKWSAADLLFLKLIKEAHHRNIKIVIDGVWNHTGTQFWAFQDVKNNQERSEYKNWYMVTSYDDPTTKDKNEFDYEGWWGYKGLPVFREENDNLVKPVQDHIFTVTRRWMDPDGDGDPSDGIDGWRLDVAEEVGKGFWYEWHKLVRTINPEAITVAEIWTDKAKEFITAGLFTSVMNYRFAYAAKDFLIDDRIGTDEFIKRLQLIEKDYPAEAAFVIQNLMDSHDAARLASIIVNPGREYDRRGHPLDSFDIRKPSDAERKIQKLVALFQFTWIGAPMIYYGTESGMWGADDPDNRKPMVWEDLTYEPESNHPLGWKRVSDDNNFDKTIYDYYQSLIKLRNNEPALQKGVPEIVYHDSKNKLVVFSRTLDNDKVWIVLNRSDKTQAVNLDKWCSNKFSNLLSGERYSSPVVKLEPISAIILK